MNFETIAVEDPEKAAVARDAYMRAARRSRSAMDRALARSYAALAEGIALLDLEATMREAGVNPETWLPRLAIVRADAKEVFLSINSDGSAVFATCELFARPRMKTRAKTARLELPRHTFKDPPAGSNLSRVWWQIHRAPTPIIPPQHRPADAYKNYFLLWEVETWQAIAPKDPLLLSHITGPIFALVAQWDLTDLERAIMNATLRRSSQ